MRRLWRHMRTLWPRWTLLPPLPFVAYFLVALHRGVVRTEHVLLVLLVIGLAYGNATSKKLCVGSYPIGLVGLLYDAMKPLKNLGLSEGRVHLCDLRDAELRWFGIDSGGERITLQDFFLAHHSPVADVYFAVPYGVYIFAAMGFAVYLFRKDFSTLQRFAWGFFVLNVAGFVTYHVYPAAPPWYFHARGCVVDLAASASEGAALARVDAMTGVHYFAGLYGRSSDVFGAMPSLHVAYPLLIALYGWPLLGRLGRAAALLFWASMCGAAVYLDHHWVFDVVVGLGYGLVVYAAFAVLAPIRRAAPRPAPSAQPALEGVGAERRLV